MSNRAHAPGVPDSIARNSYAPSPSPHASVAAPLPKPSTKLTRPPSLPPVSATHAQATHQRGIHDPRRKTTLFSQSARIAAKLDTRALRITHTVVDELINLPWVTKEIKARAQASIASPEEKPNLDPHHLLDTKGHSLEDRLEEAITQSVRPGQLGLPNAASPLERLRYATGLMDTDKFAQKSQQRQSMTEVEAQKLMPLASKMAQDKVRERFEAEQVALLEPATELLKSANDTLQSTLSPIRSWTEDKPPRFLSPVLINSIARTDPKTQASIAGRLGLDVDTPEALQHALGQAFAEAPAFQVKPGVEPPVPSDVLELASAAQHFSAEAKPGSPLKQASQEYLQAHTAYNQVLGPDHTIVSDPHVNEAYDAVLDAYMSVEESLAPISRTEVEAYTQGHRWSNQVVDKHLDGWKPARNAASKALAQLKTATRTTPELKRHLEPLEQVVVLLDHAHSERRTSLHASLTAIDAIESLAKDAKGGGVQKALDKLDSAAETIDRGGMNLEAESAHLVNHLQDRAVRIESEIRELTTHLDTAQTDLSLLDSAKAHSSTSSEVLQKSIQSRLRKKLQELEPKLTNLKANLEPLDNLDDAMLAWPRLGNDIRNLSMKDIVARADPRTISARNVSDLLRLNLHLKIDLSKLEDRMNELRRIAR